MSWRIRQGTLWAFLIVMPVGIRIDGEHDSELTIEGHAGIGQMYSIIRDCEGNPLASQQNSFADQAGAVQYCIRTGEGNFIVMGLRAGHLGSDYTLAATESAWSSSWKYDDTYWNPHLALENPHVGIGCGYLANAPAFEFDDPGSSFPLSAHLRIGNYAKSYFLMSLNENLPLASGGGHVNLGAGYPVGKRSRFFTGLSAAPYDSPGLLQKVSWAVSERFDLDLNARVGWAEGNTEYGVSVGLRYHLPLGRPSGPNPFLERQRREQWDARPRGHREVGAVGTRPRGRSEPGRIAVTRTRNGR